MVHKKYIKRGGKTFGPYFYENYRENGVTKTRYLGKAKSKPKKDFNKLFLNIAIIVLGVLIFSSIGLFFLDKEQFIAEGSGEDLASYSPLNFFKSLFIAAPSPLNHREYLYRHP